MARLTIRQRIYLLFHPHARRFRRACLAPWPEDEPTPS